MSSTALTYNGISIPYMLTTSFNQEPVYDDMGDVDYTGTKFDIQIEGYVNVDYASSGYMATTYTGTNPLPADVLAGGPAAIIKSLRSRLLEPRRTLSFFVNGIDLIPKTYRNRTEVGRPGFTVPLGTLGTSISDPEVPGVDINQNYQGVDSDNGPKPKYCNITRIYDNMFLVSYGITATFYENRRGRNINNVIGSNVLYNRWKETIEVDNLQYTKRVRTGKIKVRSDGTGDVPADIMASMAVVGVPAGFVREGSQYNLSPDGLTLDYAITDKELFKMPPDAALEAFGTYSETLGRVAAIRHGDLQLTLKSSKNISQHHLVQRCLIIAFAKMNAGGLRVRRIGAPVIRRERGLLDFAIFGPGPARPVEGSTAASGIVESIKLTINMYENEVSITMRVRFPANTPFTAATTIIWTPLSEAVPIDASVRPVPPVPLSRNWPRSAYAQLGTASLPLMAAAYYDPSLSNLRVNERTGQLENPSALTAFADVKVPGRAGDTPESFGF